MASKLELVRRHGSMRERLIVALDVDNLEQAEELVRLLAREVGMFKIGKQLFTHAGPQAVRLIQAARRRDFSRLKFHDIPNTVAKAAIEATRLGVKMFNVHASGSLEMMRTDSEGSAARLPPEKAAQADHAGGDGADESEPRRFASASALNDKVADQVVRLALLTKEAGMDGVVASPHEVADIRAACGRRFVIVTPGIRPAESQPQ